MLRSDYVESGLDVCSTGGKWKRKERKKSYFYSWKGPNTEGECSNKREKKEQFSNRKKMRQVQVILVGVKKQKGVSLKKMLLYLR